ncbi:MAG: hypothetical protein JWO86_7947 [Myxococcaceae bacterium]|nr:hypothetical protein [Myxococcaceae bacterium]
MRRLLRGAAFPASFLAVAVALLVAAPREAAAQDANGLGEKHQLILSVDRLLPVLSYTSQTVTATVGGTAFKTTDSGTSMAILFGREPSLGAVHTIPRVAFDYTIVRRLTLGGAFAFALGLGGSHSEDLPNGVTRKSDAGKTTIVGFAPRVGYVLPLGDLFAFWPRAGFAFYSVSTSTPSVAQNNTPVTTTDSDTVLSLDLDPQFAWTPVRHFFIHFGPLLNIPLSGSRSTEVANGPSSQTTKNDLSVFHVGLSAGLGGWFDL